MTDQDLVTGDLVLCTVGSYEPWPAVVVPQRVLSDSVLSAKENDQQVAVAFFNDATYYWTRPKQLKRLSEGDIKSWIKSPPKRSSKELKKAYHFASEYSTLQEFVQDRLTLEGRVDDLEEISEIEMGEDPLIAPPVDVDEPEELEKPASKKRGRRHHADSDTEDNDETVNNGNGNGNKAKQKQQQTQKSKPKQAPKNAAVKKSSSPLSPDLKKTADSSQDFNSTLTSSVSDIQQQQQQPPPKKRTKLDYTRRVEIAQIFRNKLQKCLIQRDTPPTEADLAESEKLIRKIQSHAKSSPEFFDLEALKISKLHKLLKVIKNMPELSQFHDSCTEILDIWAPHVQQIKKEKLTLKDQLSQ